MYDYLRRNVTLLFQALLLTMLYSGHCASAPTATSGGLLHFTDQSNFEKAFPGLVAEDFEESTIGDTLADFVDGPLDSSTSNNYFLPGDIADGLTIDTINMPVPPSNIIVAGGNYLALGNISKVVAAAQASLNLKLAFGNGGVNAIGMELFFANTADTATIRIYSEGDTLLETLSLPLVTTATFFGIYSLEPVTKITVENVGRYEMVDNIQFGNIANQLTFFTDKPTFEKVYPDLPLEDFEESTVPSGISTSIAAPLDKETNGPGGFATFDILEDIKIDPVVNTLSSSALEIVGDNYSTMNNPSKVICNGMGGTDLKIDFYNTTPSEIEIDTYVAAMDLWQYFPSTSPPKVTVVTIYDTFGKLIGASIVNVLAGQENFFGVASNQVILTIQIQFGGTPTAPFECVDNIQYGSIPPDGLTIFRDETIFGQARSNLPKEDFSESPVGDTGSQICNEPINSTTDQAGCFTVGDILPGISFQTETSLNPACPACMVIIGRNTPPFNNSSPMLYSSGTDPFEISFPKGNVNYVGLNMFLGLVSVYDPGDTLLGTMVNYPLLPGLRFLGFKSASPIGRITLKGSAYLDEISFGPNFPWSLYMPAVETGGTPPNRQPQ